MTEGAVLTVLGGYLGAGKTTVVNALLAQTDARVAVLVNDFGQVDVDAALVRRRTQDTIELANGCVCCSLADGVATAMAQVAARVPAFDHVVVELSGVALPGQMARWGRFPGLRPGRVVVCADAERVRAKVADRWIGDTVREQLAHAEVILLTKTDLVPATGAASTRAWLAETYPDAHVVVADHGAVPPDLLLSAGDVGPRPTADHVHDPEDPGDRHLDHVSWSATGDTPVARDTLVAYLRNLPDAVVRAKGVVRLADSPGRRTVVQLVDGRLELSQDGPWTAADRARLVVIAPPAHEHLALGAGLDLLLQGADAPCPAR